MLEKAQADRYLALRRALIEKRFSKMNDMQRAAVLTTEGPLLILAGAGSGKTTVLINRIANLLLFGRGYNSGNVPFYVDEAALGWLEQAARGEVSDDSRLSRFLADSPPRPWEIMAITFTNKAAAELKSRLSAMLGEEIGGQVHASTFHSTCVRMLRADIDRLGYRSGFAIYDSDDSQKVVKDIIKAQNLDDKQFPARSVLSKIGEFKDMLETPAQTMRRAEAASDFRLKKLAKLYDAYQKRLFEANALDFDDIITLTVRLFSEHPDVLEKYQRRYRYVMVDEYQDTNRSQYKLVSQLAGGSNNLCVVGDDDQSIYRFRGATIENILSFEQQYEGARVIRLEQNYRSTQNILTAANEVIAKNTARKGKTLWTAAGDGDKLVVYTAYDERDEAAAIADIINREHDKGGRSYSDCAVLYRMNAQSQTVESALVSAGIPYKVVGGTRFFDRKEIRDMVAYLSVLHNPADTLRLMRIINEPKRGIGDATVTSAQEIADVLGVGLFEVLQNAEEYAPLQRKSKPLMQFAAMMSGLMESAGLLPLDELLDELLEETGYRAMLLAEGVQGQTRLENIEELKTTMKRYESETEEPSLGGFLEEVALYTDLDSYDADTDSVTLMTMHAAKGLEFPVVFLPGMEEGLFPSTRSFADPEQLEEERRLAYVGITRAKEKLVMLCTKRRMLFGQTLYGRESRFLCDIAPGLVSREGRKPAPTAQSARTPEPVSFGAFGKTAAQAAAESARAGTGFGAAPKPAPAEKAGFDLAKGDRVMHRVFGGGTVISVTPMGGDHMLEVRFDKVGVKKIMAAFARLQKL
ncbi:ATP-dependent helicase [Oscillospiraceae bacterium LTW-04]|nr:3'-5' exonuclease [Oscillospiraceae bacterium MB24-C1]